MADDTRSPAAAAPDDAAFDRAGQDAVEGRTGRAGAQSPAPGGKAGDGPSAGPHATAPLTSDAATPGTGALPDGDQEGETDPGTG